MKPLKRHDCRPSVACHGYTLVEILVTSVAALSVLQGLVMMQFSNARTVNAATTNIQVGRELARLAYLLDTEVGEACAIRSGSMPGSCRQTCLTAPSTDLNVLIPVVDAGGAVSTRAIRYFLSNNQLFRTGPRTLLNGQLDLRDLQGVTTLLLDDVSEFSARTDQGCRVSSVSVSILVDNPRQLQTSTFSLNTGVSSYTN